MSQEPDMQFAFVLFSRAEIADALNASLQPGDAPSGLLLEHDDARLTDEVCEHIAEKMGSLAEVKKTYPMDGSDPVKRALRKIALELIECRHSVSSQIGTFHRFVDAIRTGKFKTADEFELVLLAQIPHVASRGVVEWLEVGEVKRARRLFDASYLRDADVKEKLEQLEEIERFGVAIYPDDIPMSERWGEPYVAPPTYEGHPINYHTPASARLAEDGSRRVVVTAVMPPRPTTGVAIWRTYSQDEWRSLGHAVPSEDGTVYGEYANYVTGEDTTTPIIFFERGSLASADGVRSTR